MENILGRRVRWGRRDEVDRCHPMIRIAITAAAYDAICSTMPEDAPLWPVRHWGRPMPHPPRGGRPRPSEAMRRPGESHSDVILRLVFARRLGSPEVKAAKRQCFRLSKPVDALRGRSDDWDRREGRRPRAHCRVADGRDCEFEEPVRRDCTNDRGVAASAVGINRVEDNKRDAFAALLRRKRPSGLRRKGRPPRQVSAFTRTLRPAAKRLPDAGGRRSSHTSASEWATPTAAEPKDIRCSRRSLGRLSTLPVWADRRTAEPRRSMAERGRARAKPPRARLPLSSCRDSLRTLATSEARRLGAAFPHSVTRRVRPAARSFADGSRAGDQERRRVDFPRQRSQGRAGRGAEKGARQARSRRLERQDRSRGRQGEGVGRDFHHRASTFIRPSNPSRW